MAMKWSMLVLVAIAMLCSLADAQRWRSFRHDAVGTTQQQSSKGGGGGGSGKKTQCTREDPLVCGPSTVSTKEECEGFGCCFDTERGQCVYNPESTLQCTKNGRFVVVVYKDDTIPKIEVDTISLLGPGEECTAKLDTYKYAVFDFPLGDCGTTITDLTIPGGEPFLEYKNKLESTRVIMEGPDGSITRDSKYELEITCLYKAQDVHSVEVVVIVPPTPVAPSPAQGPINVEIQIGNGACPLGAATCDLDVEAYNSFFAAGDYPIVRYLRVPVHVEVALTGRTDPQLVLSLGRCWATIGPVTSSLPQWDLITGCVPNPIDTRFSTTPIPVADTYLRRFVFRMFTFVDSAKVPLTDTIFIHCEANVCSKDVGACPPRCPSAGPGRKRRDLDESTTMADGTIATQVVSTKEMIFVETR